MMRTLAVALCAAATSLASSGCVVAGGPLDATDVIEETRPLAADGRLSVENTNGRIVVDTWERDEVRIEAERSAVSERALDRIDVDIDGDDRWVRIEAKLPRGSFFGSRGRVDFRLTVPATARVDAESVNGRIEIAGVKGRLEVSTTNGRIVLDDAAGQVSASTVNGSVSAAYAVAPREGEHVFSTTNGGITVEFPDEPSARVEARTVNGRIRTDFDLEVRGRIGRRAEGTLGDGGARMELRTVNGGISIRKS